MALASFALEDPGIGLDDDVEQGAFGLADAAINLDGLVEPLEVAQGSSQGLDRYALQLAVEAGAVA